MLQRCESFGVGKLVWIDPVQCADDASREIAVAELEVTQESPGAIECRERFEEIRIAIGRQGQITREPVEVQRRAIGTTLLADLWDQPCEGQPATDCQRRPVRS